MYVHARTYQRGPNVSMSTIKPSTMRCDATQRTYSRVPCISAKYCHSLRTCCYATVWGRPAASSAECPPIDARGVCRDRHEKRGGGSKRHEKEKKKWIRRVACVSTCLAFLSKTTNKERRKEGIGPLIVEASRLLRLRVVLTLAHTRIHKTRFLHSSRQYSVYFSYKSSGSTREMKRLRNGPLSIVPLSVRPLRSVDEDMAFETHEYLPTYFGPRQRRAVLPPPKCLSIQIAIPCVASVRERPRRLRCSCTGT